MAGLSCFIAVLLDKLDTVLGTTYIKEDKKYVSLIERLQSVLMSVSNVITDAEEKQFYQDDVKNWLLYLEEDLYDAEDVVDGILDWNRIFKRDDVKPKWLARVLFSPYKKSRSIREILEFIDVSAKQKEKLCLRENPMQSWIDELALSESYSFSVSTSLLDRNPIYGRDKDKHKVLEFLLSGDKNLDAIALIGMGGLGKTTLAKLVYNDKRVDAHFELKAWISIGSHFDVHRITREILVAFTSASSLGDLGLDVLQRKLRDMLAGKRFLLVLDDVWNEDASKWEALQTLLESGCLGSKIIVTTRVDIVADVMGCSTRYHPDLLTPEDCWPIVENSALRGRDRSVIKALEDIGRKIVLKCFGLPLLARAIGGLLRFKMTLHEWYHVLDELNIVSGDHTIKHILWLSYHHLPAQLKRCFAFCSLFPDGYEFEKEQLVRLWMAEGFLQQSTVHPMEKVGAECFDGLLKRSFFIPVDNSRFIMHDLMHDLAVSLSNQFCFRLESDTLRKYKTPESTRHLSLLKFSADKSSVIFEARNLRTFYVINSSSGYGSWQFTLKGWELLFATQQRLRVLSLPHFQNAKLPASIGKLKHLRHLDVSDSALERLPRSLCTLYYLQTLILTNCSSLLILPQRIVKLVNLRKLQIKGTGLKKMPEKIGRLSSLQSLSNFIVGHGGSTIKELGALPNLQGSLSVSGLQHVNSASDASAANLNAMQYLEELEMEWSCNNEDPSGGQEEVLENLKPSGELKKLSIRFYGGTVFPIWLGDSSFLKITSLHLDDCRNCESLPPVGQLSSLEHLFVERFSGIKYIGREFYGVDEYGCKPFLSLKTLKFRGMSNWEKWILFEVEGEEFPSLEELYIINCPKLVGGMPKRLLDLKKLEISECEKLAAPLPQNSELCVLNVDKSHKMQKETQDKIVSGIDDEAASLFSSSVTLTSSSLFCSNTTQPSSSKFSSSMPQTSASEIQLECIKEDLELPGKLEKTSIGPHGDEEFSQALEWDQTNKNPAGKKAVFQKDLDLLEESSIGSYGDKEFQKCLEFYSLSTITFLCVSDNDNCSSLPPLGQLPLLEHLRIERMGGVRSIGSEFYRQGFPFRQPFQSLKTLKFEAMSQWELWTTCEVEGEEFPCLQEFYIINCPKLKEDLPKSLPSLIKLEILECQQLEAVLPLTSEHCVLKLKNCDKVQIRSDDDQTVAPEVSPSIMHQEEDDNQEEPFAGEDGNQQSSDFSSMEIAQNQAVAPEVSPSTMHEKQDDNQEEPLSDEDGNQQSTKQASFIGGAAAGTGFQELMVAVLGAIKSAAMFRDVLEELQSTLLAIQPIVLDKEYKMKQFEEIISEGHKLVGKCSTIPRWKFYKNKSYTNKLRALKRSLELFCQINVQTQQMRDVKDTLVAGSCEVPEPSGKSENCDKVQMRSDDDQTVAPEASPSMIHHHQDGNQEKPLSGEDGNQQPPSSSSNLSSMDIAQNQTVEPEFSSSTMHQEQDDNQEKRECGNRKLPFSSSNHSSMDIAQNQTVALQFSPSTMHQEQDDNQKKPLSGEDGNQQFPSSSSNSSSRGTAQLIEQPADLRSLRIERHDSKRLSKEILERYSLQHLYIIDCVHLETLSLSPSLKTLYIHNCRSLEFPQPNKVKNQVVLLEDLSLGSSCDSLRVFPFSYFPKLKALSLWDCRNLEYLSIDKELQAELSSLESLEIKDCPNFRSFLEEECQAPNLTSLVFFNCRSLKSLQWIQSFKSLQSLYINKSPALESLPAEGFPSGLVILCISFCDKITPQKEWKLVEIHSLGHFEIEGGCLNLESFPEEGLLPTNLNSLRISRLSNLTSLDGPGLRSLTSLQTLEINCCGKLDSLPEHGMPSSLSSLSITDCSLLNPKLQSRKGKEWFKIAHIPSIPLDEVSD